MRILIVGSGGREHALLWALKRGPNPVTLFCAPGNGLTAELATNLQIGADDDAGILQATKTHRIELVVIGPEAPLCRGLADVLRAAGLLVFGPDRGAAELEGSKAFAKELMTRHGVPTAGHRTFRDAPDAKLYLESELSFPIVVKASGLAAGKGVVIAQNKDEAVAAVDRMMAERVFGSSGDVVVIEEYLPGEEVSVHALTDGRSVLTLPLSQDHKRALDGDLGPNTGGMGAVSPGGPLDAEGIERVESSILVPTIHALARAKRPFRGVLYAGLMVGRAGAKVLEYNVRFGDPETQVILPRWNADLASVFRHVAEGRLDELGAETFQWDSRVAVSVVLCAGGYPGAFKRGDPIRGLKEAERVPGVVIFGAGVEQRGGEIVTAGGRVLNVTGLGKSVEDARTRAYEAVAKIHFESMQFRKDIGQKAGRPARPGG